jgi:hypothetical protein
MSERRNLGRGARVLLALGALLVIALAVGSVAMSRRSTLGMRVHRAVSGTATVVDSWHDDSWLWDCDGAFVYRVTHDDQFELVEQWFGRPPKSDDVPRVLLASGNRHVHDATKSGRNAELTRAIVFVPVEPGRFNRPEVFLVENGVALRFDHGLRASGSEVALKARALHVREVRKALDEVRASDRHDLLEPFVRCDVSIARSLAVSELAAHEVVALPAFQRVIDDESRIEQLPDVVYALDGMRSPEVIPMLHAILRRELSVLRSLVGTVKPGWLEEAGQKEPALWHHQWTLWKTLDVLRDRRDKSCRPLVIELKAAVKALPPSGVDTVEKSLEAIAATFVLSEGR